MNKPACNVIMETIRPVSLINQIESSLACAGDRLNLFASIGANVVIIDGSMRRRLTGIRIK